MRRTVTTLLFSQMVLASSLLASTIPLQAQSATPTQAKAPSGHQHSRSSKPLMIANADGAAATLWAPDLTVQQAKIEHGAVTLPKTGVDNYHALVVEQDWGYYKEALIQYIYQRGKPSKESPAKLLNARKSKLEVVPAPLPREHYHYFTQQTWPFLVRFKGQPLADQAVTLQTDNGSHVEYRTDSRGLVEIPIPDDFPDLVEGERDMRSANFMVSTDHAQDGVSYSSSLVMDYRINQNHWQSLNLGIAVAGLGMLVGGFIGRVKTATPKGGKA